MAKPQVTLTLAGDESKLSQAFDRVGQSSDRMATSVGQSSKRVADETTDAYSRVDGAAGNTYDKFDALEAVGRGTTDTMSGLGEIMKGNVLQGSTDLAGGVAALADGFSGALLPAIRAVTSGGIANAKTFVQQKGALIASKAASAASTVATYAQAVAQRVLNAAMKANPIGLIITALTLLVGGFIYAYKHSEKFRNIVNGALGAVKNAASAVARFFTETVWPAMQRAWNGISSGIGTAKDKIVGAFNSVISFAKSVPGKIGGFFKGIGSSIAAPFQAAFQAVKNAWNNSVGGKGFTVPGWIPNIGGKEFRIPYFHTGGIVSGALGSESLAMLKAGERITGGRNSGGGATIVLRSDGGRVGKLLIEILQNAIRIEGGDPVRVLSPR